LCAVLWFGTFLLFGISVNFGTAIDITLLVAVCIALGYGGADAMQHYVLRLFLWRAHYMPANYARFLDYASDLIFLRKVGGGYIFIHRILQEHLADINRN
jgi:hypothetical protein